MIRKLLGNAQENFQTARDGFTRFLRAFGQRIVEDSYDETYLAAINIDKWNLFAQILSAANGSLDNPVFESVLSTVPTALQPHITYYALQNQAPIWCLAYQVDPANLQQFTDLHDRDQIELFTPTNLGLPQRRATIISTELGIEHTSLLLLDPDFNVIESEPQPDTLFMFITPQACSVTYSPDPQ